MAGLVCVGQLVCNRTPLPPVRGSERISVALLSLYESQTTILCSLLLAGNLQSEVIFIHVIATRNSLKM